MPALARGQGSDCANPALDLYTQASGTLVDVAVLEFQIFDLSDPEKRLAPVQVHPPVVGARAPVNVSAPCAGGGDKLSTGRFVALWTPSLSEPIGTHEVRWFFRLTPGAPEQTFREEFDVLPEPPGTSGYVSVAEMREEGVQASDVSDARLQRLIARASVYVEMATGRFFEPRPLTLAVDGSGGRALLLGHPIIGISGVSMSAGSLEVMPALPVTPSFFGVYNRHLSQGLLAPDDRENPRLELLYGGVWPRGVQNVIVEGVFGYTDPDGSPTGRTPELIKHVTKLLVMRELPRVGDVDRREDAQRRWRIISERTRDQSYTLDSLKQVGGFTGDPEIDGVLAAFRRPPELGSA